MAANIVLPPLKSWVTSRLTALIKDAPSEFDAAFDAFVAKDAKITFNGVPQSREEYKKLLSDEQILEQSATINIHNVVVAPSLGTQEIQVKDIIVYRLVFRMIDQYPSPSDCLVRGVQEEGP